MCHIEAGSIDTPRCSRPTPATLESAPVNRLLLIVVMVLLPLQMVWAAAAPYCGHEARLAAKKHFGHHEHQHEASPADPAAAEADSGDEAGAQHPDCQNCHLGSIATPAVPALEVAMLNPRTVRAEPASSYTSHVPFGPERPDRTRLTAAARHGSGVEFRLHDR